MLQNVSRPPGKHFSKAFAARGPNHRLGAGVTVDRDESVGDVDYLVAAAVDGIGAKNHPPVAYAELVQCKLLVFLVIQQALLGSKAIQKSFDLGPDFTQ